jgi:4-azaleucine resistance transporter AzlC
VVLHTAANVLRFVQLSQTDKKQTSGYAAGARAILPLSPAVILFGASFGVLARSAGFDPVASIVMSATTFAGSAQFAVVSVFAAGGTVVAAIAAAVLLNARYGPMGLAAARSFRGGPARRVAESQLLVDESWAVSQEGGRFDIRRMLGAGLVLYAGWVGGTVIGVIAGGTLGDPATLGLDAAFPALFLALLVPLVRNRRAFAAALAGGGIALLLIPLTPAGVPVIAATCGVLFGLLPERGERRESEREERHERVHAERRRATPSEAPS